MPKLSEIELGPNDILIPDVDDQLLAIFRQRAETLRTNLSDYILDVLARGAGLSRESLVGAYVVILDDEA